MAALLWIATGLLGAVVSARAARQFAQSPTLARRNYRGLEIPTAAGFAVVLGIIAAAGLLALLAAIAQSSARLRVHWSGTIFTTVVVAGFGLLGLWDDLVGEAGERGWRAHVRAARHGRASSGAIKIGCGLAIAFVATAFFHDGFGWVLARALVVALAANLFNLFDVRPGRASKMFLIAAVVLLFFANTLSPLIVGAIGATLAFLPYDLRERAMLGDTGANALGALVGWNVVWLASHAYLLIALGVFVLLNLLGDKPGLSRVIERVAPLRALDRAGRAPE
jgi:UDP-N-acetylmuramyl pentapeptide phosphotransferase/UDP-N-acetylglucosamine-1-phosphate transferase